MHTCSSHAPISFCLKAEFSCKAEQCNLKEVEHIQWDNEKNDIFKDILSNKMELLNSTVDNVFNQMGDLNSAVDTFANVLYSSAYTVYGKKKLLGRNQNKPVRKYRSPWFTYKCELARQELRATSRAYRKYRTIEPVLCRLFNYIFDHGIYPKSWAKGILVPIPKKGDKKDVNNYRGITLTSLFSKIFSNILDNRLRKWSENNNILNDCQFGFRKGKSTVDCIYVLSSIINKVIRKEKKKLYCAFIDFKKAFDLVYRNGIWYKLLLSGVSSKFICILQDMYKSVKTCIKVNGSLTEYFDSYMGVKQGEPLSPLLFILFINDMSEYLKDESVEVVSLEELQIFLLLFADDTVLFSYTVEGLQILLDKLSMYCEKWNVTVNVDKTVAVAFKVWK